MVTVGITMVRDEADIIEATVRRMAAQVDHVLVADNLSTDDTIGILGELEANGICRVVNDDDPAYRQAQKMTHLAQLARELFDADWIVPFDADEVWYSPNGDRVADALDELVPHNQHVVAAEVFDHVPTGVDSDEPDPFVRMGWRRTERLSLPKVACKWRPDLRIDQGNHGASYDAFAPAVFAPLLVVRHFPYRSAEQFVRKARNGAAAYRAAGNAIHADVGAHWRQWGDLLEAEGEEAVANIFRHWHWRADPRVPVVIEGERQPALIWDPAP